MLKRVVEASLTRISRSIKSMLQTESSESASSRLQCNNSSLLVKERLKINKAREDLQLRAIKEAVSRQIMGRPSTLVIKA